MLQKIQQRLSGWVLWVLVIIISLGFMLWGVENYFDKNPSTANKAIGKVNGLDIFSSDVAREFNTIASRMAAQNNNQLPEYVRPIIEQQAVNSVILSKVVQTLAKKLGFAYSQHEIEKYLPNFNAFIENGQFSEEKFYQTIHTLGYSSSQDFINNLRNNLIADQIRTGVVGTEVATQAEFEFWGKISGQKRTFKYLTIPADLFKKEMRASDDEIKKYYEKYKEQFKVDELLTLEYVELSGSDLRKTITIDKNSIKEYYEDNEKQFSLPQKWLVAHILLKTDDDRDIKSLANKIVELSKKGEPFSKLAKKYSDDKLTSAKGGDLYWFTEGSLDDRLEDAIKKIGAVGEISEIIEVDNGIEIFKLLKVQKASQKSVQEVSGIIKEKLIKKKLKKRFQELSEDLEDISYANPDSLEEVAKQLNLQIKETQSFSRKTPGKYGITKIARVVSAAYHKDVYEDDNNSLPIRIADDQIIVLRIKEKKPERVKSLDEVKDELKFAIELKLSREKVQVFLGDLDNDLQSGKSVKKILKEHKIKWESVEKVDRSNQDIPKNIISLAFSIEDSSKKLKSFPNGAVSTGQFGLVDVEKIIYPDLSKVDDDTRQRIYDHITRYYSSMMYNLYIDSLKSQSEIKIIKLDNQKS